MSALMKLLHVLELLEPLIDELAEWLRSRQEGVNHAKSDYPPPEDSNRG